jgi:hypothetical protein
MRRFFSHVLKQPKAVRNNYAMALAGTFTGLIALVWVVTKVGGAGTLPVTAAENTAGGFATLLKETKEQAAAVQASFKEQLANKGGVATTSEAVPTLEETIASSTEEAIAAYGTATTTGSTTYTSSHVAVPVLIGTTTATTTATANGTATSTP